MDTIIETEVKRTKLKQLLWYTGGLLLLLAVLLWSIHAWVGVTLDSDKVMTAAVEMGDIENTLTASGEVLPAFEETISSSVNATIRQVLLPPGSTVEAGTPVLLLDKATAQTDYEKLTFQLESRHNDMRKLKLELDKSYYDLQSNNEVKHLRIASLEADVENAKRLYKAGGGTRESIEKAELELKVARLEKQQLENDLTNRQQTMQLQLREAAITASIQENELKQLQHKLAQAKVSASRHGVVTWVNRNVGIAIHEGEPVARIADLSSFTIQGSITDTYLPQLYNGQPVIVKVNDSRIRGVITHIQPSVQNNIAGFEVQPDTAGYALLRPNMKVEVYVVTESHKQVLRLANGPAFKGPALQDIFVVKNGVARRRSVEIGLSNFDYVEIKGNVQPGEVVIISDMSRYKNVQNITIHP
ncbi:HlyD family secretion protein [Filimonas lacunae]|uniref:HlyD family secretion protein n=1 Tax=Filimonas lacunae TaxID=477680 RepID=A0A173MN69_9BACT|nr:HlyD family efflux transporter periplasmic adaptor subunit [Filimonas lacunae]BAV08936.1 ABC transporter, permease protein [Filimonas lacunae]SIS64299.1 HlyD family secretion protein [Filimonas lacunae]